ncbi:MAG: BREX-2 system adenine-specific DNA-methyltransferase PglX, partial [Limisphaerales bacterium]
MPTSTLLPDLQRLLKKLEDDLRRRSEGEPEIQGRLRTQYDAAKAAKRTAAAFSVWRDELVTQIGVAWILGCVFVRFLEDNDFLDQPLISGPGDRRKRAEEQTDEYFRAHPIDSETNYLEHVFRTVRELPSMGGLFDERHNPLWQFSPSGDMGRELLRFWRTVDPDSGVLKYEFGKHASAAGGAPTGHPPGETPAATEAGDPTRFLGDLYQDLSEAARKRFALLQTPIFVEEFILDRTLDPAIATFGLATVRMIDPTCGSGHFLLGAFHRLLGRWQRQEPGISVRELVQRALDAVHGVDLNPFAVAIARFRLLIAALGACEITRLRNAPAFRLHVAAGDSLLHGPGYEFLPGGVGVVSHHYEVEDLVELQRLLGQRYHAVVGNPPYITVKDKALNQLYRERFGSCHRKYSLAAPFMELFFYLAVRGDGTPAKPAGQVGMITANSFMKREFGKKLIESFLPGWDLTHVIDTDKAKIPGHATGTVILFGKHQLPVSPFVRTVMGIKKQEPAPVVSARGLVWLAIVGQVDQPGSQSDFVSVGDMHRESFHRHPWSIGGGGAAGLKEALDEAGSQNLGIIASSLGFASFAGLDDAFIGDRAAFLRVGVPAALIRAFVPGDIVRDWMISANEHAFAPYDQEFDLIKFEVSSRWARFLWPNRFCLESVVSFGGRTRKDLGDEWWGWYRWIPEKYRIASSITFGEVATHNHFVLDRGGKVFKQTAPVNKLPAEATEDDHLRLLGLLNSSTACFWLKQVCHDKGAGGIGGGISAEAWEHRFAFNGTQVGGLPIPPSQTIVQARKLYKMAGELALVAPHTVLFTDSSRNAEAVDATRGLWRESYHQMIALQEELDWECYRLYGLIEEEFTLAVDQVPGIKLGERAFEIVLARRMAAGEENTEWFARHDSTPITEIPTHWPEPYRELVGRRIQVIQDNPNIRLIERPEYKRRWNL